MIPPLRVAICGCGPAGLAAALLLQRAGHSVRLFERFARAQPVGSGLLLQPTGLGVLAVLGLIDRLANLGEPIDRIIGRVGGSQRVVLNVRYNALGEGWRALAVHRAALFGALHEAALAAGIEIVHACEAVRAEVSDDEAALICADGQRHGGFDLIIDAAGANSPLAKGIARRHVLPYGALWVNVPCAHGWPRTPNALEQRYTRASMMAGVLPVGSRAPGEPRLCAFFWSLRRDQFAAWRDAGIAEWKRKVEGLWPEALSLIEPITETSELTFAQYDHFTADNPVSKRMVHIGDAGRATSPQLGQGANMALLDALGLALALEQGDCLDDALRRYVKMRYWHVRMFQWASRTFTPFYQSDGFWLPFVRDWIAAPLSHLPIGRQVLVRLVSGMTFAPISGTPYAPLRLGQG